MPRQETARESRRGPRNRKFPALEGTRDSSRKVADLSALSFDSPAISARRVMEEDRSKSLRYRPCTLQSVVRPTRNTKFYGRAELRLNTITRSPERVAIIIRTAASHRIVRGVSKARVTLCVRRSETVLAGLIVILKEELRFITAALCSLRK